MSGETPCTTPDLRTLARGHQTSAGTASEESNSSSAVLVSTHKEVHTRPYLGLPNLVEIHQTEATSETKPTKDSEKHHVYISL